jgi:hypothetical protein
MLIQEMKDCPFCGMKPVYDYPTKNSVRIKCSGCAVTFNQRFLRLTREELLNAMIRTWNKRVSC